MAKHALVAAVALLLGAFLAGNADVLVQTFFPKETLVARISLGGEDKKDRTSVPPAVEFCSFGKLKEESSLGPVVFSKVAWMGDAESFNNEWIEIKNISAGPVDVSGWQILDKDEQIKAVLSGNIGSEKFLVLRRGEDYEGNLRNSDEGLRLFDKSCNLVDEVLANPDWPAGDNKNKIPMRRNLENFSWYTSQEVQPPQEIETVAEKININTAGLEELQKITGVGPVIAGRIVEYRETNGPFRQIEDIIKVKGIGEVTFQKLKGEISL
jgi:comEA protein